MHRAGRDEADIQAPQPEAGQQARVPGPDEDPRGAGDAQSPTAEGAGASRREGRREVERHQRPLGEAFPREVRIRRSAEIRSLLERGKRRRTRNLDVFFADSPASHSRVGVIVPKYGHRIVDRNLLKRRLREIARKDVLPGLGAAGTISDVLVRAKRTAYGVPYAVLRRELLESVEGLCSKGC